MNFNRIAKSVVGLVIALSAVGVHAESVTHYDEPGFYPGREYINGHMSEFIDPFTGNLSLQFVDLFIPGNGGFDLKVQRSYNRMNQWQLLSPFGRGWDIHFGRVRHAANVVCTMAAGQSMILELPDGSQQTLHRSDGVAGATSTTDYLTTKFWKGQCNPSVPDSINIFAPDGTKYEMSESNSGDVGYWHVKTITDRNGNWFSFTYTSMSNGGRRVVSSISARDGRSVTFNYSANKLYSISGANRIWNYTVTTISGGSNELTRVQPPAGGYWDYLYNGDLGSSAGSWSLNRMVNPRGGVIDYTYAFINFLPGVVGWTPATVVTRKTAGSDYWTFAYSPSCPGSGYDTTTVTLPASAGTITYRHFGYCSVNAGDVWKVGLLYQKSIGGGQETFTWTPHKISSESQIRPGYNKQDLQINRPLLANSTILRDGLNYTSNYASFDSYGNPASLSESGTRSRTHSYTYHNDTSRWIVGFPASDTVNGVGVNRGFDGNGNVISEARIGVTTTFGYAYDGSVQHSTNARNNTTTYTYTLGIPTYESRPAGVTISRGVDSVGNVTSESDGVSTWGYAYDGINRITGVTYPANSSANISWTNTSRSLTRGGYNETTQFDGFGRTTSVTRGGIQTSFTNDALGQKTFQSLPGSGSGTTFHYDTLGRVTSTASAAGTKNYSYSSGNITITDERGNATTYSYDRYGDPDSGFVTAVNSPAGTTVSMTRDLLGTLLSAAQGGITRSYGYDSHLFLTSINEPETGTTSLGRDAVGNMTSKMVGNRTIGYTYDGLDRVTAIAYPNPTGTVNLTRDKRGKITNVASPVAQRDYTYDANGNLTEDRLSIDGQTFTVDYAFDSIDSLNTISYPMNKGIVTYSPDTLGRPTRALPYVNSVGYFPSGNLSSMIYGNNVSHNYSEDGLQRPSSILASAVQLNRGYSYDGVGNVTQILDNYVSSENRYLGYDGADRLISAIGPWGSYGSIDYDGAGNITRQQYGPGYQVWFNYSSNRLSSITGTTPKTFGYVDGGGNLTTVNNVQVYSYDAGNQLTCAFCGTAGEIQYGYDGQGKRVFELKGGRKTYFVQAPSGDLQFEYTPYGKVWTKQIYLHGKRVASETDSDATTTTTALSASPSTTTYGNGVTLTVSVSPGSTGTVEFRENTQVLGTANLSGSQAQLVLGNLTVGTHSVVAVYGGDANNKPSTSTAVSIVINIGTASVSLTASPTTGPLGQQVTLNAAASGTSPSGQVTFKEGATVLGTGTLASGAAAFVTSGLGAGGHAFTATYSGDGNNQGATSNTATATISQATPGASLVSSNPSSTFGSSVTFTAAVSGITGFTPTGTATFLDGAQAIGTGGLTNSSAAMATSSLSTGTHSITASYGGDANYTASTSNAITQQISKATDGVSLTVSGQRLKAGQPLTLTATVSGNMPSGTVHFLDNGIEIAAASVVNGIASVRVPLAAGLHVLRAVYDGDQNNIGSASPDVSRKVVFDPGITTLNPALMD